MLATQAAVTAAAVPFEGVDPDEVMKKLYDLRDSYATINGKQFWASYVNAKWAKLDTNQKSKTLTFWQDNIEELHTALLL
jgi:hypothetical protein